MASYWKQLFALGTVSMLMTACQTIDTMQLKKLTDSAPSGTNGSEALIYCSGTHDCNFERIDDIKIINAENRHVESEALKLKLVRLQAQSLKDPNPVYLAVPAGQHELVVRFYPISPDKAEVLHVFQNFQAKHKYTFKMYRQRSARSTSLLQASAPDPLCVDLLQDTKTIRRFCKPYNVQTGIAEFVEQKI
ncbi:hypothetical protein BS636_03475 [Acinetobacter sp. LoGeW2-3]|uniref:hypothetical protein n=1 Tax=Acinetobacter sp. LoGeW2-3 TaxID=1808001 RepID=UPI000C05ADA5|nr:hypothetical protein [Acinetobacter sp. LoGeW2-3]ATO18792.1 hypothetical protein BS636_03475 [Acinetobacter sp. LoGeW2-3]